MNKTKELIETWKEFQKSLNYAEHALVWERGCYENPADFDNHANKVYEFKKFWIRIDEIIKSLEAENGHSN